MNNWLLKAVKALVLVVILMASASVLAFAVSAALAMAAVCLIALLTAYVVSPGDVKSIVTALTAKFDTWMSQITALVQSMAEVVKTVAETAKSAAGIETPQEAVRTETAEASEVEVPESTPEENAAARRQRRRPRYRRPAQEGGRSEGADAAPGADQAEKP